MEIYIFMDKQEIIKFLMNTIKMIKRELYFLPKQSVLNFVFIKKEKSLSCHPEKPI